MQKQDLFVTKKSGDLFPSHLIDKGILHNRRGARKFQREKMVLETLHRYWASADVDITVDHAPRVITTIRENGEHEEVVTDNEKRVSFVGLFHNCRMINPCLCYIKDLTI